MTENKYYCEACKKQIKDGRGWGGHLRSTKHIRNTETLKKKKPEKEEEEPTENPEPENTEIIKVDDAGRESGKGGEELIIKIVDGTEGKPEEKPGALDRIADFITSPENQPVISMLGSFIGEMMQKKVPTPEQQGPQWGKDQNGVDIEF